ncbi:hypothetical protein Sru01_64970 [Sphaerisporangium rufum]|uniref:Uncharacterized protein n=1 Tax=Sphaerisporangium rufum TaxID=1381558 RepID=A0A919RCN5_9ACTN|nr:DUF6416 domain-containing protein [Sphaerisporangium rufum]GII81515.1 hypothetical protein Sru01_64970 [Sphaerisporangium rufum]
MSETVRLPLGPGTELTMSRTRAEQLVMSWSRQLGLSTALVGAVLPDDHPQWERHTGGEGHRDNPEWNLESDLTVAEAFYRSIKNQAKIFFDLLIDHPGQQLSVDDIRRITGGVLSRSHSIAGALSGFSRSQQASGRRYPFYWWEGKPTCYAMKPSVAELFRQARDQVETG